MIPGQHPRWLDPLYGAASGLYSAAVGARSWAYDRGWLSVTKVARPVISVGNLAVGGTGKTPFVILLAERLLPRKVGILSRGYGRKEKAAPLVVSTGDGPLVSAEAGGDEPCLLARRTRAIIVVDPDRVRGAARAIELGAEVLILDDGFQHRRLARDLDVVILSGDRPLSRERLLPRGSLREPPSALSRAQLLVRVGGDNGLPNDQPTLEVEVVPLAVGKDDPSILLGRSVALWSAIARPERFRRTVEALGAKVVLEVSQPDHAFAAPEDLTAFEAAAKALGAELCLTTEKDQARQGDHGRILALSIGHRIVAGEAHLDGALDRIFGARP